MSDGYDIGPQDELAAQAEPLIRAAVERGVTFAAVRATWIDPEKRYGFKVIEAPEDYYRGGYLWRYYNLPRWLAAR